MNQCCYIHTGEETAFAKALASLIMASDPTPVSKADDLIITDHLEGLAAEYGFGSWIELFHADLTREEPLTTANVKALGCHRAADFEIIGNGYDRDATYACEQHAGVLAAPLDDPVGEPSSEWVLVREPGEL